MSNPAPILLDPTIVKHVRTADMLPQRLVLPQWTLSYLAGKLIELRGSGASAVLTAGLGLIRGAQEALEPAVWVTSTESIFFPVDAEAWGVDLNALAIIRVPGEIPMLRASDKLVRSGAFGLIVLDYVSLLPPPMHKRNKHSAMPGAISLSHQARLLGLAQKHQTAIVFLTSKDCALSVMGSLISLRAEVQHREVEATCHEMQIRILKDKQRGPGWHHEEHCCGPAGLC